MDALASCVCVHRGGHPPQIYNRAALIDFWSEGGTGQTCCRQVAGGNLGTPILEREKEIKRLVAG